MEYAVSMWIMKIHIIPEEYKTQHMKTKSHTSIMKSKVKYIHKWILKTLEEYILEGIVIEWLYSE